MSIATETRKLIQRLESMIKSMESTLEKAEGTLVARSDEWLESPRGEFTANQVSAFEAALNDARRLHKIARLIELEFEP